MNHSLKHLLKGFVTVLEDITITGLTNDSRTVKKGDLFLAYPGQCHDARIHIQHALDKGANAVCYSNDDGFEFHTKNIHVLAVPKLKQLSGCIANRFYKEPSSKIDVIGVTGTNGKTTIAHMLTQAYELMGEKAAYIGTLGTSIGTEQFTPTVNTTPDSLLCHKTLHQFAQKKIKHVAMEVSSHALSQERVNAIEFNQAIFTNLSHEHLDYHKSMQAYARAKSKLFLMPSLEQAIINGDDPWGIEISDVVAHDVELLTYGRANTNHVSVIDAKVNMDGITLLCKTPWGEIKVENNALLGEFNIYNLLAVLTSLGARGISLDKIACVLSQIKSVPGRMQVVKRKPTVIVDYAHTPDALEKALATVGAMTHGEVLVVFGCGGDRDSEKRPIMGYIANKNSDKIFITNDNPRFENPLEIAMQIEKGIVDKEKIMMELDRKLAIEKAIKHAKPIDVILIAGKGHEDYQIIGHKTLSFCDAKVASELHTKLASS